MTPTITILAFGDVVGKTGKAGLRKALRRKVEELKPSFVIVNGENISGGLGIETQCFNDLMSFGVDAVTLGDHAFQKRGSTELLEQNAKTLVRPANFPPNVAGSGYAIIRKDPYPKIGVVNLLGRVFIEKSLDCPFRCLDALLEGPLSDCPIVLVDFHAEATSEKAALARHFDGRISLIWGTHTHVQTNDASRLPKGTGFITDLGMCGPEDSVIGMESERAIDRLLYGLPSQYKSAKGDAVVNGIVAKISLEDYSTTEIEPFREIVKL